MGVMLPDALNNTLNLDTDTLCQDIKQIILNSTYRHSDVYKDCSYPDIVSHRSFFSKASRTRPKQQSKKVCNHKTKKMEFDQETWSKVYKSPVSKRSCVQKPLITESNSSDPTEYKLVCTLELQKKLDDQTDADTPTVIKEEIDATRAVEPKRCVWRKVLPKVMLPKLVCPCCTGGGSDSGEPAPAVARDPPYQMRSPAASYETVDLTRHSNIALQSLNLDASLQSILNLRGHARQINAPRKCVNMLINVLRNTYKNAALIVTQPRS